MKEYLVKLGPLYLAKIEEDGRTSWTINRSGACLVSWETAEEIQGRIPDAVILAGHPIFDKGVQYV